MKNLIKQSQEEFDKKFGNDLEKRDGICLKQPCECCDNTALKILDWHTQQQKALLEDLKAKIKKEILKEWQEEAMETKFIFSIIEAYHLDDLIKEI